MKLIYLIIPTRNVTSEKIAVVLVQDYACLVPFTKDEEEIFLKTIIPSHKATKQYLGKSNEPI